MSNQIFHFSNTGVSSGQRFYLKDDVSGIFLTNLNIDTNFPITTYGNLQVSGTGIFNAIDLNNIDNLSLSGVDITIQNATVDLGNSKLINAVPEFINETTNFLISGNYNSRMIMVNSATEVTGTIISGNALGFNTTIMQVGSEQVLITGSGIGITINEYAHQYRTAGAFAAVTLLHTGTNGYVMYGNTAS